MCFESELSDVVLSSTEHIHPVIFVFSLFSAVVVLCVSLVFWPDPISCTAWVRFPVCHVLRFLSCFGPVSGRRASVELVCWGVLRGSSSISKFCHVGAQVSFGWLLCFSPLLPVWPRLCLCSASAPRGTCENALPLRGTALHRLVCG